MKKQLVKKMLREGYVPVREIKTGIMYLVKGYTSGIASTWKDIVLLPWNRHDLITIKSDIRLI